MRKICFGLLLCTRLIARAEDVPLKSIYIDQGKNVHLTTSDGKDLQLTKNGKATRAALSEDKYTAAWMIENTWVAEGDDGPGSSELVVYRSGNVHHLKCEPFIREYWFWEGGKQVAIDCGGRHFAGTLSLYDAVTLKEVESFFQPNVPENKQPAWSMPGSSYDPDKTH